MYTDLSLPKIKKTCERLHSASRTVLIDSIPLFALELDGYKTSNTSPVGDYKSFDGRVSGLDKRIWIKADVITPLAEPGCKYYLEVDTGINGWDSLNPQLIFYLDGKMASGLDVNHREVRLEPNRAYKTDCYYYGGNQVANSRVTYRLVKVNERVEKLYYDMLVPYEACRDVYSSNSGEYAATMAVLERAANQLDLRDCSSSEFFEGVERADEIMRTEFYEKLCSTDGKPTVNCIGHTHIDVEWLWDRRQTREKMQRSASTALALMKEYPEYKFMLSQPELYRYLKEEAPEKFDEVREAVREGRWEPEGALYLECDCNLISGESFVRQLLYGKKFFREELGVDSRICFLPDVFGYSGAMPQILKLSGIDCFITSKISWNDTNTMPYDVFMWRGIDGTEIFSSFITGQSYRRCPPIRNTTYVGDITPAFIYGTWDRFGQKGYCTDVIDTYGFGDGGGGPTREMLERARRLEAGLPGMPVAKLTTLADYVDKVSAQFGRGCRELRRTPRWTGELYLEYHRGTYTSAAANKRSNRKSELALARSEALCATDMFLLGGEYPKAELDGNWTKLLHNQFHDILPGSSIHSVYEFTKQDYAEIAESTDRICKEKLTLIADKINTGGGILVYNPLGFSRRGEIVADGVTITTPTEIPALGYAVIPKPRANCTVQLGEGRMSNDYYDITLDSAGRILSLFDKRIGREVVPQGCTMNEYRVYEDDPEKYDAWEMDEYMQIKSYVLDTPAVITPVIDGDRAGFTLERKYMSSTITETVWLYSSSPRIELENRIDWHEKHQTLKLAFPVDVNSTGATCEIQFGSISRPTHTNTSWDKAKFEICAHRWIDLSEHGYGVALLNDCKFGHSAQGNLITLTCLKCPSYPDPDQDVGLHEFTCAILPHVGDLCESGVIREAHALNQPLVSMPIVAHGGSLPESFSMISVDEQSVVIDGIKRAEGSDAVIVRLYESFGGSVNAHLRLPHGVSRAALCDLMENEQTELEIKNGLVSLPLHAFQIATLKLEK